VSQPPSDQSKAAEQLMAAMERTLREGHDAWEPHQRDPEWDHLSAALTALYMAWKFAAHTGLLPHGPVATDERQADD
jgi:hypothetical protein